MRNQATMTSAVALAVRLMVNVLFGFLITFSRTPPGDWRVQRILEFASIVKYCPGVMVTLLVPAAIVARPAELNLTGPFASRAVPLTSSISARTLTPSTLVSARAEDAKAF